MPSLAKTKSKSLKPKKVAFKNGHKNGHKNGIKVWSANRSKLDYAHGTATSPISSAECATQRTAYSRHSTAKERGAVEIHSGQFPPEFADLACFIAVALVADAKRLCGVAGRSPV